MTFSVRLVRGIAAGHGFRLTIEKLGIAFVSPLVWSAICATREVVELRSTWPLAPGMPEAADLLDGLKDQSETAGKSSSAIYYDGVVLAAISIALFMVIESLSSLLFLPREYPGTESYNTAQTVILSYPSSLW